MTRILYTGVLILNFVLFLISCKDSNLEKDGNDQIMIESKNLNVDKSNKDVENIAGIYTSSTTAGDACNFSIEISESAGTYIYILKSSRKDKEGILLLEKSDSGGEQNILLEGLKYDSYEGDKSSKNAPNIEMSGVSALLKDNSITIQNTGNSMNSFTIFKDCDAKYIELKKQ